METQKIHIKDYLSSKYLTTCLYPQIEELLEKSNNMLKEIEKFLEKIEKSNGGRSHVE